MSIAKFSAVVLMTFTLSWIKWYHFALIFYAFPDSSRSGTDALCLACQPFLMPFRYCPLCLVPAFASLAHSLVSPHRCNFYLLRVSRGFAKRVCADVLESEPLYMEISL